MINQKIQDRWVDIFLTSLLILIGALRIWNQVFNGQSVADLVNFTTFSYVANRVLFPVDFSFAINSQITGVVPTESMPLLYPPGIYVMTKLISWVNESHLMMNMFLFILQMLNIGFVYALLRKFSSRAISFSLTLFLIAYTTVLTLVVDSFIQPLLAIILFLLVSRDGHHSRWKLILCGVLTGMTWFIRQNVGLFLSCAILAWLLFSHLIQSPDKNKSGRRFLVVAVCGCLALGLLPLKVISQIDDKIWYLLAYFCFWGFMLRHVLSDKKISVDLIEFLKRAGLFLLPIAIMIVCWFLYFGNTVGLRKYFYLQYIMPVHFISVFSYSMTFNLQLAWQSFLASAASTSANARGGSFLSLLQWMAVYFVPLFVNVLVVGYGVFQVFVRKTIDKRDLMMMVLPVVGILNCFPIESYWIASSKQIIFILPLAYFLAKASKKTKVVVCLLFVSLAMPRFLAVSVNYLKGEYARRNATYQQVSQKENFRLPPDISKELQKGIALIKSKIGNSKFYIVDSYADLEMFYGLVDYRHPNYYIFLRNDATSDAASYDLIKRLKDYPYILIHKDDYEQFKADRRAYVQRSRAIDESLMEYILRNYQMNASYVKPAEVDDIWLVDFYILKRKE